MEFLDVLRSHLQYVLLPIQVFLVLLTLYHFCIGVYGGLYISLRYQKTKSRVLASPMKRFAIVVAAHNEENVIEQLIKNLQELDYPKSLYDIYTICDNCTDATAEKAKRSGAHVLIRKNEIEKGKGFALNWGFNRIWEIENKKGIRYDGVLVFDADNLVSRNFLLEMNQDLINGKKVIQAYIDTKNPEDSWVTRSYAIAYWFMNRMWQLARYNIGLPNALGGTGMCFDANILKKYGWGATSLTEDLEFTALLVLNGESTSWNHYARIYDEKPLGFKASWKQRLRWMQGHADVASRYTFKLFLNFIRRGSLASLDTAIYLIQPARIVLYTLTMCFTILSVFYPIKSNFIFGFTLPPWLWLIVLFMQYFTPAAGLFLEKVPYRHYKGLLLYPLFTLTWIPLTFLGIKKRKEKTWTHTLHTRNISHEQINKN